MAVLFVEGRQAETSLGEYFAYSCNERIHQALGDRTPAEVYAGG